MEQLSFEDCFITRNRLRKSYGLVELYDCGGGNDIIPPDELEHEHDMCKYWLYYDASCRAGIPPKCFDEWKKGLESEQK